MLSKALIAAGEALAAFNEVDEKHIVIITDSATTPDDIDTQYALRKNADLGIQTTVIGIEAIESDSALMKKLLVEYAGMRESDYYDVQHKEDIPYTVRNALQKIRYEEE